MVRRHHAIVLAGCFAACAGSPAPESVWSPPPSAPAPALATARVVSAPPPSASPNAASAGKTEPSAGSPSAWSVEPIGLPGAVGPVSLDYLFYEPQRSRVWVPAGGTGNVDVFDTASHAFLQVAGFRTAEREAHGKMRVLGPSAGAIGEGFAYLGNRATHEVCVVDLQTLKLNSCLRLSAATDGVAYVAATQEVWVTTPGTQSLVVLDASKPRFLHPASVIKLPGDPEGYAVDESRGVFLTNLEDKRSTLAIDLKTHAVRETWNAGCSSEGPRGIAVDSARSLLFVACTDHVQVLDSAHGGALLGKLDTGAGLDNIDYVASTGLLYAAAGKAARLTVAHVGAQGELTVVATGETAIGARNAVADATGTAYVADPQGGRLLLLRAVH